MNPPTNSPPPESIQLWLEILHQMANPPAQSCRPDEDDPVCHSISTIARMLNVEASVVAQASRDMAAVRLINLVNPGDSRFYTLTSEGAALAKS